jgi:O-antigen ligase
MAVALAVMYWWAAKEGGQPVTDWYPGALGILVVVVIAIYLLPARLSSVPRVTRIAGGLLLAYAGWSYVSILWADAKGDAWDGANRALLYFLVFALFAAWRQRGPTAAVLLGLWSFGITIVAGVKLLAITNAADPVGSFFIGRRLVEPAGYANANAATFLMALWPALMLAGRREVPWWLRGPFAGFAVILADVALLSQSRGSIFSLPIVLALYFLTVPERARSIAVLAPIAIGIGLTVPGVLDVANRLGAGQTPSAVLSDVATPIFLAAFLVAGVVCAGAARETFRPIAPDQGERLRRAIERAGAGAAALVVVGAIVASGNPFTTVSDGWHSFKKTYPANPDPTKTRLTGGLGSNRYDFYRVSVDRFGDRPIAGIGADNFAHDYLARRKSGEQPKYPHSLELRTLLQTGLIGALLLFGAIAAALVGAIRATRRNEGLAAAAAGAATVVFVYWLVHGSADWFWEFAGLGGPAFAMLGLACALQPRPPRTPGDRARLTGGIPATAGAAAVALVVAFSFMAPWSAAIDTEAGARAFKDSDDAVTAYRRLDRAQQLNPLDNRAFDVAGSIAVARDELDRAHDEFAGSLGRDSRDAYAALELGAIASELGRSAEADTWLSRAHSLNPSDPVTETALKTARAGKRLQIVEINRQIAEGARAVIR